MKTTIRKSLFALPPPAAGADVAVASIGASATTTNARTASCFRTVPPIRTKTMPGTLQRDEAADLAGLGVAGDGVDEVDLPRGSGRPAAPSPASSASTSTGTSTAPAATTSTSTPFAVWRTWYSTMVGVFTSVLRTTIGWSSVVP